MEHVLAQKIVKREVALSQELAQVASEFVASVSQLKNRFQG